MRRHMDIGQATRMSTQRSGSQIQGDCVSDLLLYIGDICVSKLVRLVILQLNIFTILNYVYPISNYVWTSARVLSAWNHTLPGLQLHKAH